MQNQCYFKNLQVILIRKHQKKVGLEGWPSLLQGVTWPWPLNFGPFFFPKTLVFDKNQLTFYELNWFSTKI